MRRRIIDDDERQPGWFWRFLKGVLVSLVLCAIAVAAISLYLLPPAELPQPKEASTAPAGPVIVDGIVVSDQPAYSAAPTAEPAPTPVEPDAPGPIQLAGPALTVNAIPFEADLETPLVAVVLDDTAAEPFLHELLFALKVPLTVGVVAGGGGDRVIAEKARAAGFEVVAQIPIAAPGASEGSGLEYGLPEEEAARRTDLLLRRVPMAVAVSRPLADGTPPDSGVLVGISDAAAPHGFGYLEHGLETMDAPPGPAAGMAAPVGASRFAIPAGTALAEIIGVLDAAAADAAIRGSAIVVAAPSEELLGALQLWGGEGMAGNAKLAPLSAAIRRQAES